MPTITHVFKTYYPDSQGGLEEAIRQIGKYSLLNGFDVNVVSISKNPSESILDGIKCKSYKYSCGMSTMPISFELLKDIKNIIHKSDIIQLHYPIPYSEMLMLFSRISKPIIITFHGEIVGRDILLKLYRPFVDRLFNKATVIVPTNSNLVKTTPILQRFESKTNIINLWLDQDRFNKLQDVDQNFKVKIKKYFSYALFVGVLRWYKGLDVLLDAAKDIKENIIIAGKGPEMNRLKSRIRKEGIKNVFLLGYVSDQEVAYLYRQSKFFVLPSQTRGECFGQVLLEACYFQKPMISTELGTGTSIVNVNNYTGFVVEPKNSHELAEKMNILFEEDDLRERFAINANKHYKANYTDKIQGDKYIELYNKLLNDQLL